MPIAATGNPVFARPFFNAREDGLHHRRRVEPVRPGHEAGAEAQFDVIQPLAGGVLDVFPRDAPARGEVTEDGRHPLDAPQPGNEVGLDAVDLDVRAQRFHGVGRQPDAVLRGEVEDGLQADVAVEVTVQVNEGQGRVHRGD